MSGGEGRDAARTPSKPFFIDFKAEKGIEGNISLFSVIFHDKAQFAEMGLDRITNYINEAFRE